MAFFPGFPSGTPTGGGRRSDSRNQWSPRFSTTMGLMLSVLFLQVISFPGNLLPREGLPAYPTAASCTGGKLWFRALSKLKTIPSHRRAHNGAESPGYHVVFECVEVPWPNDTLANYNAKRRPSTQMSLNALDLLFLCLIAAEASDIPILEDASLLNDPGFKPPEAGSNANVPENANSGVQAGGSDESQSSSQSASASEQGAASGSDIASADSTASTQEKKEPLNAANDTAASAAAEASGVANGLPVKLQSTRRYQRPYSPRPQETDPSISGAAQSAEEGLPQRPSAETPPGPSTSAIPKTEPEESPPPPEANPPPSMSGTTTDAAHAEPTTPKDPQALPTEDLPPPPPELLEPFDDGTQTSGGPPAAPSGEGNAPNLQPISPQTEWSAASADGLPDLPPPPPPLPLLPPVGSPAEHAGPPMTSGQPPASTEGSSSSQAGPSPPSAESTLGRGEASAPPVDRPPSRPAVTTGEASTEHGTAASGAASPTEKLPPPPPAPQTPESGGSSETEASKPAPVVPPPVTHSTPDETAPIKSELGDSLTDRATNCPELLVPFTEEKTAQLDEKVRDMRADSSANSLKNFAGFLAKPIEILKALDEQQRLSPSLADLYYEYLKNHKDKWRRDNPRVPEMTLLILPSNVLNPSDQSALEATLTGVFALWNFKRFKNSSVVAVWQAQPDIFGVTLVDLELERDGELKATLRTYSPVLTTDTYLSPSLFKVLTDRFQQAGLKATILHKSDYAVEAFSGSELREDSQLYNCLVTYQLVAGCVPRLSLKEAPIFRKTMTLQLLEWYGRINAPIPKRRNST